MTGIYGYSMATGLQSGIHSGFGPMAAGSGPTLLRFHPYTDYGVSGQRNIYRANGEAEFYAGNNVSCATEPGNYISGSGHIFETGAFLANSFYYQDYLSHHAKTKQINYQNRLDTNTLQNVCGQETGTSRPVSTSSMRKDRSHPFYWRKRVEPAEGMTRTRDKYRVVYTEKQRKGLETEYNTNKFITTERRAEISEELNLSARQIKIWFQNRRAKERRDSRRSKDTEQTGTNTDEDNDVDIPNSLANADFSASCRFTGSDAQPRERLNSSGQCRFMNHSQSVNRSPSSNGCFFESRDSEALRHSSSPSDWTTPDDNNFIHSLDISPLTGNTNFDFGLRF